jgi:large subunit ribosomal protein L9
MKVILSQNVPRVGQKNDVKDVSNGYARHFLFAHNLAKPATDEALKVVAGQREKTEHARAAALEKHHALVEKLKSIVLQFKMKVADESKTFGSVSTADIQDALKKQGVRVEKDWIQLEESIKTTGEHMVKITFPQGMIGEVKVVVEAE